MSKYHMRRKELEIKNRSTINKILKQGKYVVISMCRKNEPYIVTLSYGYDQKKNCLYFHCSPKGLKIDFIKSNPNVCATVIEDGGYKTGECKQGYRSIVLWGKMYIIQKLNEKKYAIDVLLKHLEGGSDKYKQESLKSDEPYKKVGILRLDIEETTVKRGY